MPPGGTEHVVNPSGDTRRTAPEGYSATMAGDGIACADVFVMESFATNWPVFLPRQTPFNLTLTCVLTSVGGVGSIMPSMQAMSTMPPTASWEVSALITFENNFFPFAVPSTASNAFVVPPAGFSKAKD